MSAIKAIFSLAGFVSLGALITLMAFLLKGEPFALTVLWTAIVPLAPIIFFLAPNLWVSLCPFAYAQSLPARWGWQPAHRLSASHQKQLAILAWLILFLLVPLRHCIFDIYPLISGITVLLLIGAALFSGLLFVGLSGWCGSLCPVRPVEFLYGQFHLNQIKPSHCHPCSACISKCPRIDNRHWATDSLHWHFAFLFPGFVVGFFRMKTEPYILDSYLHFSLWLLLSWSVFYCLAHIFKVQTVLKICGFSAISFYYLFIIPRIQQAWDLTDLTTNLLFTAVAGLILIGTFFQLLRSNLIQKIAELT